MEYIRNLIIRNLLSEALDEIVKQATYPELKRQIRVLVAKYNELENQERIGVISRSEFNLERNQITYAALGFIDEIEKTSTPDSTHITIGTPATPAESVSSLPGSGIYFSMCMDEDQEDLLLHRLIDDLSHALSSDGFELMPDMPSFVTDIRMLDEEEKAEGLIVVMLSDAYLKSTESMYELYRMYRAIRFDLAQASKHILPIFVEKIDLNNPLVLREYDIHWKEQEKGWEEYVEQSSPRPVNKAQKKQHQIVQLINLDFNNIVGWITTTETLKMKSVRENNFQKIKEAIHKRLSDSS
ncbi:MAG: hypothetical protein AAF587_31800 [Bacteroidota bacterium]